MNKIISGGQTGVDLAALDAAITFNISYGGWCPKGRINEKGLIPEKYQALKEISGNFKNQQENYNTRTLWNIRDSDGTLVLVPKIPLPTEIKDGTLLTIDETVQNPKKPYLMVDLSLPQQENIEAIISWIKQHQINILNIGGPRESSYPGIYQLSFEFLEKTIHELKPTCKLGEKF